MKLLFVVALALLLSSVALATPDSSQLGQYTVSFDLNTDMQYQKSVVEPTEAGVQTLSQLRIFTDNSTAASISVVEYKDLTDATISMHKSLMTFQMILSGFNVTSVEDMTIDGKPGFVEESVPVSSALGMPADAKLYSAMYWIDSAACGDCGAVSAGKTYVAVSSSYPQDVTQSLLSSLHVEMGQATAAAATTTQDMPPAQN
ncbi:MAG: hypothetical protein EHM14_13700 [Methanothrix sp.]|nr:MAG: hypothetical protein EHM14_13700 [Methanothrix sp.]